MSKPGVFGPGMLIGYCKGCPNCRGKTKQPTGLEEVIEAAVQKLRKRN